MFNSFKFKAFKKLQKRIISLEDYLWLKFSWDWYPEHFKWEYWEYIRIVESVESIKKDVEELKNLNKTRESKK